MPKLVAKVAKEGNVMVLKHESWFPSDYLPREGSILTNLTGIKYNLHSSFFLSRFPAPSSMNQSQVTLRPLDLNRYHCFASSRPPSLVRYRYHRATRPGREMCTSFTSHRIYGFGKQKRKISTTTSFVPLYPQESSTHFLTHHQATNHSPLPRI